MGGVKKEFFSLFMKEYIDNNDVFESFSKETSTTLWFKQKSLIKSAIDHVQESKKPKLNDEHLYSSEYLIGVMLGLAFYHRVLVNFPIPAHLYKLMKGSKVSTYSHEIITCDNSACIRCSSQSVIYGVLMQIWQEISNFC